MNASKAGKGLRALMGEASVFALALAFAVACVCSLAGCSDDSRPSPENPVTLSLWHVYGSQTESPMNELVAEFNATVGAENGVTVTITSVTDSDAIDSALAASVAGDPGSAAMPDLFTAYPRVAQTVGAEDLLDWSAYLASDELDRYVDDFLAEGYFDGRLLMLPIAKSTEMLFLNETLFERFAVEVGASTSDLASFDTLFPLCERYAAWSNGQSLFQINDFYHYFLAAAEAVDATFASVEGLNCDDEWFEQAWLPLARAGISGGLCVGDGYASDRWKTGEVLCNVGSTAGILYLRDYVTYSDGSIEDIETAVLPYPAFADGKSVAMQRGGGLFAMANDDERVNEAAAIFARWITLQEANLAFTSEAGYLPVTEDSFANLLNGVDALENEKYRMLYETAASVWGDCEFCAAPVFENSGDIQDRFEETVKSVLHEARAAYLERIDAGEDEQAVCAELTASSLIAIRAAV